MKILYIANLRLPTEKAHGVQIMHMCNAFASAINTPPQPPPFKGGEKEGVLTDVTLIVPFRFRTAGLRGVKDIYDYYGVEKNFRIVRLPSLDIFPLTRLFPFLDRFAFAVQYGTFLLSCFFYLTITYKIKAISSIVYTRDSRIARLARRLTKNIFLELHTIPKPDDIAAARDVRGIITVTRKLQDMLMQEGVIAEKIFVAPDAARFETFVQISESIQDLRKALHLPQDAVLIGYSGRLKTFDQEKGIPELLEAYAQVHAAHPNTRLVILGGDSSDVSAYADYLRTYTLASRVHFIPHVSPREVPRYLKAMDVLVAPFPKTEHYAHAMSPLKVFEYMAAGKPVVVSDLPSIREVLTEEEAFFFEPGNAKDLAYALLNVLKNSEEANRRAANARKKAEEYTWQKRAGRILEFMKSIH